MPLDIQINTHDIRTEDTIFCKMPTTFNLVTLNGKYYSILLY